MVFARKGAKTQRKTSCYRRSAFASLRLCARILLFIAVASSPVYSQAEIAFPDLTSVEPEVRDQITALQNALSAALKTPNTSDAEKSEAYGKLGQLYHAYSMTAPARVCYLQANNLAPKEFRWNYLLGRLEHQEGRFEDAIRHYELAKTLRPDYVATHVNLGNIFLELNRLEDAAASLKKALELEASNPAAHYGMGQVANSKRSYAEAADHFEKTLARVPSANRVHYSLAMAYRALGDTEKAKAHLAKQGSVGVRVADPVFEGLQELIAGERVYLARGKVAFEAGRFADAAKEFRKALSSKPDSVTARINLGAALTQLGDAKSAIEQFEEALRLDMTNVNANYNLAILLAKENRHVEAIALLRAVLHVEPNDLNARLLLARELSRTEQLEEALEEFARVRLKDSANETALLDEVKLLYRMKRYKQALDLLERAHTQFPTKGRTIAMLAFVLATSPEVEQRNGTRALNLAQRVYEATRSAEHGALVAAALAELGRCNEAAEWQRRMITATEQAGHTHLLAELRATLKHYETPATCRPPAQTNLPKH